MAFEGCADEIAKAVGRELDDKERNDLGKKIQTIVANIERKQSGADLHLEVLKATKELADEIKISALNKKRNQAINQSKTALSIDYVYNTWKNQPEEGIKAKFGQSAANREGARAGMSGDIGTKESKWRGALMADLSKGDENGSLIKIARSKSMDKEIWTAMWEMGQKTPNEEALSKLPKEAVSIGKIFSEHTEKARLAANEAGANISKHVGYVINQSHDSVEISKAAGALIPTGDERHFQAWKSFISDRLDWDKTMKDVPREELDKVLRSQFEQLSNGYHLTFGEGGKTNGMGTANIGSKMSHERVLNFKDAISEFEYHEKFGRSQSVIEGVMNGLQKSARDTAIMENMGPNAEANLKNWISGIEHKYTADGRGDLALKARKEFNSQMKTAWPTLTGAINVPGNQVVAQLSRFVRNMEQLNMLGSVALSHIAEIPGTGSTMNYIGARSAKGMFDGVIEGIHSALGHFTTAYKPHEQQLASELGVIIDSVAHSLSVDHSADGFNVPGRTAEAVKTFLKYTGITKLQDGIRTGSVFARAHEWASYAHMPFEELRPGMQEFFAQHGLKSNEWDLIRQSEKFIDPEGRAYLTPERIKDLPDAAFAKALEERDWKNTKGSITSLKNEITNSYSRLFNDVAHMATSEPTLMNRAAMLRGTNPGTLVGETVRHVGLFKAFAQSTFQKHIGRELYGYRADKLSFPQAFAKLFTEPSSQGTAGMAQLMVYATVFGYASNTAKQLSKGITPRVPEGNTPGEYALSAGKLLGASALSGGALPLYGDFLFGEKARNGQNSLVSLLGPTAGTLSDTKDLFDTVKSGDIPKSSKMLNYGLHYTPGVASAYNLFYTKAALDYMFVYKLHEYTHPGYLRQMERKLKTDTGQEYMIPPSSVIPRGGF